MSLEKITTKNSRFLVGVGLVSLALLGGGLAYANSQHSLLNPPSFYGPSSHYTVIGQESVPQDYISNSRPVVEIPGVTPPTSLNLKYNN